MEQLGPRDLDQIGRWLEARRQALRARLPAGRGAAVEPFADVAGTVHSLSDESFAELDASVRSAAFDREADALQDVEQTLARLRDRSYGYCLECGGPIARERLLADPTVKHCLPCQRRREDMRGGRDPTPSL